MYVVTGATGNTGSVVAHRLLNQGKEVRVIGRSADRLQQLAARGAEPYVADITDQADLARVFAGAEAVYAMLPPHISSQDVPAEQQHMIEAIAGALEQAKVRHAVSLSSIGADQDSGTGPVVWLHAFEDRLNRVAGLNVLHLRCGYFMENTLSQAGTIAALGKAAGPLRGDLKLPLIATRDIGAAAADALGALDFSGHQIRELQGQRDLSMDEATAIIGKAIDKPGLEYIQLPDEQVRPVLMQMGMSANVAALILEMAAALNSGHMRVLEARSPRNTTSTSFETFVAEEFVPLYKSQSRAA